MNDESSDASLKKEKIVIIAMVLSFIISLSFLSINITGFAIAENNNGTYNLAGIVFLAIFTFLLYIFLNKKTILKKAQTSIEFMVLVSVLLFFFAIFFLAIQESSADKIREQQDNSVRETALAIQDEIALASKSSEGYSRDFEVPDKIGNQDYSVSLVENMVYIKTYDNKSAIALPVNKITGSIVKGKNTIRNQNNELSIN